MLLTTTSPPSPPSSFRSKYCVLYTLRTPPHLPNLSVRGPSYELNALAALRPSSVSSAVLLMIVSFP